MVIEEARVIESLVANIITESHNLRYLEYETDVRNLSYHINELIKSIQDRDEAIKKERQQAYADMMAKISMINLSKAINSKDIDKADTLRSITNKKITQSNNPSLKEEFIAICNNYDKQKQRGISVFEEECYVNYDININTSDTYPIVRSPRKGCIIWPHRRRQIARRGYTEEGFQNRLSPFFKRLFDVIGDANLLPQSGCRPYEPDIAIVDLNSGYNLRIDIEIDEPYAGLSNKPTHYIGCGDVFRDENINRLGWMVVRFSEYQIHTQPLNCIAFICRIITRIIPNVNFDQKLLKVADPEREKQWEQLDSQKWATQKYRQQYLNHEFGVVENDFP